MIPVVGLVELLQLYPKHGNHINLSSTQFLSSTAKEPGILPKYRHKLRFELAPLVTVGLVRGRARGVGSEFLQALDIRFASRERAILSQIEVGTGIIPGGGGLDRLPRLIGRARAMEVILGAEDFDADTAERYGWVNRSIPDAELDEFVERFATRVASFDRAAIAAVKDILNQRAGLATPADLISTQKRFLETLTWPGSKARIGSLLERGLQTRGDLESRLGQFL